MSAIFSVFVAAGILFLLLPFVSFRFEICNGLRNLVYCFNHESGNAVHTCHLRRGALMSDIMFILKSEYIL